MGLGDEYVLEPVETEQGNRDVYAETVDPDSTEPAIQALYDMLAETEDDTIEVPDRLQPLIGPVGAGKTHHRPKNGTKQRRKQAGDDPGEGPDLFGHYHEPGF